MKKDFFNVDTLPAALKALAIKKAESAGLNVDEFLRFTVAAVNDDIYAEVLKDRISLGAEIKKDAEAKAEEHKKSEFWTGRSVGEYQAYLREQPLEPEVKKAVDESLARLRAADKATANNPTYSMSAGSIAAPGSFPHGIKQ